MEANAPKFKVGDKVVFTTPTGVEHHGLTITEVVETPGEEVRYNCTPNQFPDWRYLESGFSPE